MILNEFFDSNTNQPKITEGIAPQDNDPWGPQGNFAGDKHVDIGGVTMKIIQVGDTVKYLGQQAKVVGMSKDRKYSRISIGSGFGGSVKDVLTADLKQSGQGVAEGDLQEIQRTKGDEEGLSTKGQNWGKKTLSKIKMLPGSQRFGYTAGAAGSDASFVNADTIIELFDIKHPQDGLRKAGFLSLRSAPWFPIKNSYQVSNVGLDDEYRGTGLGQSLYGIAMKLLKMTIVADDSQTPQARSTWVRLSQIPGVSINGYTSIFRDDWAQGNNPDEIYDDSVLRLIRALSKANGQVLGQNSDFVWVSFPVGANADKGELQSVQKGIAIYSSQHPEEGGTTNGLYARWGGQVSEQGVAEGANDTIYPNAEVIKSKNGRPVGEIYQDENGWGFFHYGMDGGNDFIDSREDAIQGLKDFHTENRGRRPDYTIKGVAEVSRDTLKSYQQKVSADSMKHSADPTKRSQQKANRSVAGFAKAQNRLEQGVAEGSFGQNVQQHKHGSIVTDKDGNRYKVVGYQGRALVLQGIMDKKRVTMFPHQLSGQGVAEGTAQDESEQSHGWIADSIDEINYNTFEVHLTNTRSGESADLVIRPVDMIGISGKLQIETIDVRDLATGDTQSWTTEMPDPQGAIVDAIDALFWDNPKLNKKLYAIVDAHSKKGQDMLPGQKNRAKVGMAAPADQFIAGQDAIAKAKGTVKEFDAQGFQQRYTLYKDSHEIEKFGDIDDAIEYAKDDQRDGDDPSAVYKIVDFNQQVVWDSNPYEKPSRIQLRKPGVAEVSDATKQSYKAKSQAQAKELEPHAKSGEYRDIAQRAIDRRQRGLNRLAGRADAVAAQTLARRVSEGLTVPEGRPALGQANITTLIQTYKRNEPFAELSFGKSGDLRINRQQMRLIMDHYLKLQTPEEKHDFVYETMSRMLKLIAMFDSYNIDVRSQISVQPGQTSPVPGAQPQLFELDAGEVKDTRLSRALKQARAEFPTAGSDIEAFLKLVMSNDDRDLATMDRMQAVNKKQSQLLDRIQTVDQKQNQEINNLESELDRVTQINQNLERELDRIQSAKPSAAADSKDRKDAGDKPVAGKPAAKVDLPVGQDISTKTAKKTKSQVPSKVGYGIPTSYKTTLQPPKYSMPQLQAPAQAQLPATAQRTADQSDLFRDITDVIPRAVAPSTNGIKRNPVISSLDQEITDIFQPAANDDEAQRQANAESRDPKRAIAHTDFDSPEWHEKVRDIGRRAKQGPLKTVWDEKRKVYRNVPVDRPPANNKPNMTEARLQRRAVLLKILES